MWVSDWGGIGAAWSRGPALAAAPAACCAAVCPPPRRCPACAPASHACSPPDPSVPPPPQMFVSLPLLLFIVSNTWHTVRARGALAPVVKAEVRWPGWCQAGCAPGQGGPAQRRWAARLCAGRCCNQLMSHTACMARLAPAPPAGGGQRRRQRGGAAPAAPPGPALRVAAGPTAARRAGAARPPGARPLHLQARLAGGKGRGRRGDIQGRALSPCLLACGHGGGPPPPRCPASKLHGCSPLLPPHPPRAACRRPGQFVRILCPNIDAAPSEWHPFTLSSSPGERVELRWRCAAAAGAVWLCLLGRRASGSLANVCPAPPFPPACR